MVVRIAGKRMYLWRAVDHEGEVLDMLVQRRRDKRAALRLMRKLLRKQGFAPKLLTTDKLGSYGSAFRELRLTCPHQQGLRANNRAENSHQLVAIKRPDRLGRGGLGQRWSANLYLAAIPQIDRRGKHHLVAGLNTVANLDFSPEVAHFGDLAAVHHAVLDHQHVETISVENDCPGRYDQGRRLARNLELHRAIHPRAQFPAAIGKVDLGQQGPGRRVQGLGNPRDLARK